MMDPELMAALGGGGGGAPPGMAPPMPPGPGGPGMPMMSPPTPGGTPADSALPIILMLQQQQAEQASQLHDQQASELLSAMAAAVGQLPNPLGAAAMSEGALPPAPDALDAAPVDDPAMAMGGV